MKPAGDSHDSSNINSMHQKSYGRQSPDKTIKSVSLSKELVEYGEEQAKKTGLSFSQWVNDLLEKQSRQSKKRKKGEE
jgi:hypothetical protein